LTAADCRSLAVANAPFAADLDDHPDNKPVSIHKWCPPSEKAKAAARASAIARGHAADELRNRAAGEALEQFFQLAQSEWQVQLIRRGQHELRTQIEQADRAIAAGLQDRAGVDSLRGQVLGLEAQAAQVEANLGSLNISLRARLGIASNDPLPLWPDDPLHIRAEVVDPDQAVRTGLHYRPDLNLLRSLLSVEGEEGAEVQQAVLSSVNPLLRSGQGSSTGPFAPLLGLLSGKKERLAGFARRQIEASLANRERLAEAEIRAAASSLAGHRAAAGARAAEVRQLNATIAELQKKQEQGVNVTAELMKGKLDLLKAKGDLLKTQADWNMAEAKLRQTMGLLVRE
ncbi:MAG TPA: TolC family protein, partial [Gemmataceae bacterium]|nr:TolC family protein [Gemmataceae bacterium]